MASLPPPRLQRVLPLLSRRVVAVDPGSRCLKIVVADNTLGRVHFARREVVDLVTEALVTPEEIQEHLRKTFPELAGAPLALVLGQNRCINQVLDLPDVRRDDLRDRLREEAARLSGLPADSLSCESVRLPPYAHYQRPLWLTLCKTREVDVLIERYGTPFAEPDDDSGPPRLFDVVTTAHALLAAAHHRRLPGDNAVFVDLGLNTTTVVLQARGHGVFATSLPRGSGSIAAALAKSAGITAEEAELRRQSQNLFVGENADPAVAKAVEAWAVELRLAISEWLEDHASLGLNAGALSAWICGAGAAQTGLLDHVNSLGGLRFQLWPAGRATPPSAADLSFVVAEGAALHAFGHVRHRVSLLPSEYRLGVHRQFAWEIAQAVLLALLLGLAGVLGFGIWQQSRLLAQKLELTASATESLAHARRVDELFSRINSQFERVRPVFQRQRETLRLLEALGAVGRSRTNDSFWYVLFADAASYAGGGTLPVPETNRPPAAPVPAPAALTTNGTARQEFIAEICVPAEGEAMRATLSQVVSDLKSSDVFHWVDALPPERRRLDLVDNRVVISNHWFGLSMETLEDDLPQPLRLNYDRRSRPSLGPGTNTNGFRRPGVAGGPPASGTATPPR